MTFFQRTATLAVVTSALGGLISTSTPGKAAQIERSSTSIPVISPANNALDGTPVPQMVQSLPVEEVAAVPASFNTLAEAVDAHRDMLAEDEEALRCLATTIFYESKGEPLAGQLAVAKVVINRARSGRFASDICSVVKQRGQFSFVRRGVLPSVDEGHRLYRTARAVAQVALADAWASPAEGALYFNGRRAGLPGLTKVGVIGNHIFYR